MGDSSNAVGIEKLDKDNFQPWKFRMTNYLIGKGLWGFVTGEDVEPVLPETNVTADELKAWKAWNEKDKKVMFVISQNVSNAMIGHIQSVSTAKDAWETLEKLYYSNTKPKKIQLKKELNNMKKTPSTSVNDYLLKIKEIVDALGSIGAPPDDDDVVAATLNGLQADEKWKSFTTSINVRENFPDFDELKSLMIIEEQNMGGPSTSRGPREQAQAFYTDNTRGRGRGFVRSRGGGRFGGQYQNQQNQNFAENSGRGRGRGNIRARGSLRGRGAWQNRQNSNSDVCYICGRYGHYANECYHRDNNRRFGRGGNQQNNYASTSNRDGGEHLFVMQHMMSATTQDVSADDVWYVDSGASNHMTHHKNWFHEMHEPQKAGYVETGDDSMHPIEHIGKVSLCMPDGQKKHMTDVLHVPTITKNLVSVGQMVEQGLQVKFNKHGCFVEDFQAGCRLVAKGKRIGRMFTLDVNMPTKDAALFTQANAVITDLDIWHKRIGHVNVQRLKSMQTKGIVNGLPPRFAASEMQKVCAACQFGKQARHSFPHERNVSSRVLDVIHTDVWGPTQTRSLAGSSYYVTFIDDYSRKVWIYFMKAKSEVFEHFRNFKTRVEKETGMYIKCLRSDGGGEYFSHEFSRFLDDQGIRRQFTCRYTPQQNGVAERKNRHIAEIARALMSEKEMPNMYWAEAVHTAVYIMNRTPTAAIHDKTPEQMFTGVRSDLSHLKVFGCIAYVHIPDELRTKLDAKAEKCIFVGYSLEQKGYRCYNPVTHQIRVSRDVVFDELKSWYGAPRELCVDAEKEEVSVKETQPESRVFSGPGESSGSPSKVSPWSGRLRAKDGSPNASIGSTESAIRSAKGKEKVADFDVSAGHSSGDESLDEEFGIPSVKTPGVQRMQGSASVRRSNRVRHPVERLKYDGFAAHHYAYMANVVQVQEPTCFEEAVGKEEWDNAMDEEMAALDTNSTWELTPLPEGKRAIGCKWVYKVKHNVDGSISRYKARLVAKGYAQTYGIDFEETFSPVAKMATVRAVISLAASKRWKMYQMDVKNAFLNGELEEEVYMEQPEGYVHPDFSDYVCRLRKALYGLKQAPRAWTNRFSTYLQSIGFEISKADHSLYVKKTGGGLIVIVVYVDDVIITGDDESEIDRVKRMLKAEFDMKDLGELMYFLGIEVVRTSEGIWLLQRKYMLDMLHKFGMTACKPIGTPIEQNAKLRADVGEVLDDPTMYRKMVGSLIYATLTRPDMCHDVGVLSQFMQVPRKPHLDALRRVLRYVKGTLNYGLFYAYGADVEVCGYTDADWAGSSYDRKSTSGYVFSLGSGAVSWSSKKQPTVALSSTEAEYRGAAMAACEIAWLRKLLQSFGYTFMQPITLFCDNMSSIQLASNPVFHARTKHIEVHYHYVREKVLAHEIDLVYVSTHEQVADIFTKSLGTEKLQKFRAMLGVQDFGSSLRGSVRMSSSTCDPPG